MRNKKQRQKIPMRENESDPDNFTNKNESSTDYVSKK